MQVPWAQWVPALDRCGREAGPAACRELQQVTGDEPGADPSPGLEEPERRILEITPGLAATRGRTDAELPRGVVTFLLTDIERSTELWDRQPVPMAEALERHEELVAQAVSGRRGHVLKSRGEGDATLSVFQRASDAIASAVELHGTLEAEPWPDGIELRVRIALHTGEAQEREGDYFGPALNRAARVRALAQGGQVLLSNVTAELVRDRLPEGAALADAGEHALRGLTRGEHVFELRPAGAGLARPTPAQTARPPLPDGMSTADAALFVGRETELGRIDRLWSEVTTGALRLAFLAGEPGIGKTRLAARFAGRAFENGAVVLYGRCDEVSAAPYQPFVEALRHYTGAVPPDQRRHVPGAVDLAYLIPEFAPDQSRTHGPEDAEVARYRLFEAVSGLFAHAALAGPLVLLLDDLHWADRPTLMLLRHILRAHRGSAILVIGTYRESDIGRTRPFSQTLGELRRERAFERMVLRGLGEDEVVAVLEQTAQHDVGRRGRRLARALVETTEGNPFFIEQVLDHLVESGQVVRREGRLVLEQRVEDLGIPEGVRDAVGHRLSRLSDECNRALAAASVLGRDFEVDVLTQMLERDPEVVLGAVEEALQVGLIRELPTHGQAMCSFSHALVQQALYEELPFARSQRLHLKAAAAIEAAYAQDIELHVARLARHLRAGGPTADAEKAIDYSIRAMEVARRVFAFDEAIVHGEAALEMMGERGADPRRASVLERLGDLSWVAGIDYARGIANLEAAQRLLDTVDDQASVARVHVKLGRAYSSFWGPMDIPRALEHLNAAERLSGASPDPRVAGPLTVQLAWAAAAALDMEATAVWSRRAMELGKVSGNMAIWASGATAHAGWLHFQGRMDEGFTLIRAAWAEADRIDHLAAAWTAAWAYGVFCLYVDPRDAHDFLRRELDTPREAQAVNNRRALLPQIQAALLRMGDIDEASELLVDEPLHLETVRAGPPMSLYTGDWIEAERLLHDHIAGLRKAGALHVLGHQLWWLGHLHAMRGDADMARRVLEELLEVVVERHRGFELSAHARLAILDANSGALAEARRHLELCDHLVERGQGWRARLGEVALARGTTTAAAGELSEAEGAFADAVETFRQYSLPWDQAEALHMWGRALLDAGRRESAVEKLDAAIHIYRSRGAGEVWVDRVLADRRGVE